MIKKNISYEIFAPSKNITALVTSYTPLNMQLNIAEEILEKEKLVEQVGFIKIDGDIVYLRMAGGEFCGNATMSAAAYFAKKNNLKNGNVKVSASEKKLPINVRIDYISHNNWYGIVDMPKAIRVEDIRFPNGIVLPVIFFEGIAHIIYDGFIDKEKSETYIKDWIKFLNVEALGIIFVNKEFKKITPLVYVKALNTLYWENACASGSSAVAIWLSTCDNKEINISFMQPGGDNIEINVDKNKNVKLKGVVKYISNNSL